MTTEAMMPILRDAVVALRRAAARRVEQHYSVQQAAELLAVSERTIWRRVQDRSITPVIHLSPRDIRIPASALQAYLDSLAVRSYESETQAS